MFSYFSFVFFHSLKELYFLECDVGQSEFTPPGLISLNRVCEPLLGSIKKVMSMASLMANILPGLMCSTLDQVSRFEPWLASDAVLCSWTSHILKSHSASLHPGV